MLRLLSDSMAAAIAHGMSRPSLTTDSDAHENAVVVDLGGGAVDVSVMTIEEGVFEVKATAGHTHFGGLDFDLRLFTHLAAEFQRQHGRDISGHPVRRLRSACAEPNL